MTTYRLYTTATAYWLGSGPVYLYVYPKISIDGVEDSSITCEGYNSRPSDSIQNANASLSVFSSIDSTQVVEKEYELKDGDTLQIETPYRRATYSGGSYKDDTYGFCEVSKFPFRITVPANGTTVPNFDVPQLAITNGYTASNGWTPGQTVESSKNERTVTGLICNGTVTGVQPLEIYYPSWGSGTSYSSSLQRTDVTKCYKITFTAPSGTVINVKVGGSWKESKPYVNVNGTWKEVKEGYVNVNGTWKEIS